MVAEETWLPPLKRVQCQRYELSYDFHMLKATFEKTFIKNLPHYNTDMTNRKSDRLVVRNMLNIGLSKVLILCRAIAIQNLLCVRFLAVRADLGLSRPRKIKA